jgi:hypothetical protein
VIGSIRLVEISVIDCPGKLEHPKGPGGWACFGENKK